MCKDADLQGQFSNHSLRATTATRGLEKGISDKLIMERTSHRDIRSLQRYQRPDVSTKIEISKALNCRSEGSVGEREAESSLKREVDQLVDDEVKRFCQDDNNATVKGSNSVVFQNHSTSQYGAQSRSVQCKKNMADASCQPVKTEFS